MAARVAEPPPLAAALRVGKGYQCSRTGRQEFGSSELLRRRLSANVNPKSVTVHLLQIFVSSEEVSVGKPSSQLHMLPAANQTGWKP
ncbi:hypothetical protein F2P81_007846 [Scophthalmus maximus]|uniref:Uncharacterized protein n=1 Tax=Scophthalmus maximus TaxID=52904 RepID=A0A6A4T9D2_SCOMX|nr:hypothetical protein F2P81_007846 [Scophthalmus maximus]